MKPALKKFIDHLEAATPNSMSSQALKQCVLEAGIRNLPVDELVSFTDLQYKRNLVYVSNKCEVVVLCYMEGQSTPIHDHGDTIGVTIVQSGIMTEELFSRQRGDIIKPTLKREFIEGELSSTDPTTIHRVSNVHTAELITINVYLPPLRQINVYNRENTYIKIWTIDRDNNFNQSS